MTLLHTALQAIAAVANGNRCHTRLTIHEHESPTAAECGHIWRTVALDAQGRVEECFRCGRQRLREPGRRRFKYARY